MSNKQEMGLEARAMCTIICREVLDILASEQLAVTKLNEIEGLIKSWVTANDLNIDAVKRAHGFYFISRD